MWAVLDYTKTKLIERELLLIKVSILGPEHLHEQLPTAKLDDTVEFEDENLTNFDKVSLGVFMSTSSKSQSYG